MPRRARKRNTTSTRGGYRPGAGRKRGTAVATANLHVRLSPAELAEIERRADAAGCKVSEFVRRTLLQPAENTAFSGDEQKSTATV